MATYFTATMTYTGPEPHHRLCFQEGMVTLQQRGKDNFLVRYGMQVVWGLTYGQACCELGKSLMHQMAGEEKLDNRGKGER